jgi:DNA-directed RNA polymerase subunit H (RpoH/RPB5)
MPMTPCLARPAVPDPLAATVMLRRGDVLPSIRLSPAAGELR